MSIVSIDPSYRHRGDSRLSLIRYLAKTSSQLLHDLKNHDIPAVATSVTSIRTHDLPPIKDALQSIRTQDVPALATQLEDIRGHDLPALASSLQQTRIQDLPAVRREITSSVTSNASHIIHVLGTEGRQTRNIVLDQGQVTGQEIANLKTSIQEMFISNNGDLEVTLLPTLRQHMDGCTEVLVQELRTFQGQANYLSSSQGSRSTPSQPASASSYSSYASDHMGTKRRGVVKWQGAIPLGFGTVSLRREERQRILLRIRRNMQERDTSIDTESIYTLGFVPNSWFFGNSILGCNWKYSIKTSRPLTAEHPAWKAVRMDDVEALVDYFRQGLLSINDTDLYTGNSLLHVAAEKRSLQVCEWLVDNGVDTQATNTFLETAVFALALGLPMNEGDSQGNMSPSLNHLPYDPLINLLVERCQLDPNDQNKWGQSPMEANSSLDVGRFGLLFRLSLPLCTEPVGHRIQQSFNSMVEYWGDDTQEAINVAPLKFLLSEYRKTGLPVEDSEGRKWWQTTRFLWRLVEDVISPYRDGTEEAEETPSYAIDPLWVENLLCDFIDSGVVLHSKIDGRTLFDCILQDPTDMNHLERLLRWLAFLHKAGTATIKNYLAQEQLLHPRGQLVEHVSHTYREYPIITVTYADTPDCVVVTKGCLMLDLPRVSPMPMPGSFAIDPEIELCQERDLMLEKRDTGEESLVYIEREEMIAKAANPADAINDATVHDWELEDGRRGKMYELFSISTAGFVHNDYSMKTALTFARDFERHPLWIEYSDSWIAIGAECRPRATVVEWGLNSN